MFIYLSKKIAIPNGVKLACVSWNSEQGWIACGGDNGLLKVLKLDAGTGKAAAASNLSMNQTLEGHNGTVKVVTWNENYRKLTTSDQYGLIIVWMLHKGMWFEEMINNRNKSVVRDMKWTADGQKICIVYEDGAVIVGSVDGNRLWGKELPLQLALVEWSPDGRLILFCTVQGECHVYDSNGNPISKMPAYALEGVSGNSIVVAIDWYDGLEGYSDPNAPALALCYDNGRVQMQRHENDDKAIIIDTGMRAGRMKWNTAGTVLAVAGSAQGADLREQPMVQLYSNFGLHLRSLRVPGSGVSAVSWEGGGLRIALAVDQYIYFANVRPDYRWGYFGKTLVYAFNKPDRAEHCVMFWDTETGERYAKYVKRLISIRACEDYCVLATHAEEPGQYILILCNAIGSPMDSKYIEVQPTFVSMTPYHVVVASDSAVYVWQYRTGVSKLTSTTAPGSEWRKDGRERLFHADERTISDDTTFQKVKDMGPSADPICCVCASSKQIMLGRESGVVMRYSLPHLVLEQKHVLRCRPQVLSLNSDSSMMSIIDINGLLTLYDLHANDGAGEHLQFERKDAWDMCWADDNPELFAMMEKTRMYIFRGTEPEEPVQSSGYICGFSDLQIKAVMLDDIMRMPDSPEADAVVNFETKSLRDTRHMLSSVTLGDAYSYVDDNSHPRLWRILAEHALKQLDFVIADKAFVRCADFQGIQFVKRLQVLDEPNIQSAEVCAYFKKFDQAEALYREIDRSDLAVDMRVRMGDWFRVEKLIQEGGGNDAMLATARNKIGDYYAERQKWGKAVGYYTQAKNTDQLISCFYALEDYKGLEKLIATLPDGSPALRSIGDKFMSVGMCDHAVAALLKAGDVKGAVDACVLLNKWDTAITLAEQHNFPQIEGVLSKYAGYLLDQNKRLAAVDLYRKANKCLEAARLLIGMAKEAASAKVHPLRAKKLYLLAALEVDRFRKRTLSAEAGDGAGATRTAGAPPPPPPPRRRRRAPPACPPPTATPWRARPRPRAL
mmetsp:Transcript_7812/g.27429  ORF Transcript_7812/g.27429 Transcript_7812/m.27429 type:complete len:1008 (-) Transcript_7812:93-3116(-)